jgi:geranylgeranyl diphosphate synthase type I
MDIDKRWQDPQEHLDHICRYALLPGGKLLRPILLLDACIMVGGDPQQVIPAAIGAEYGHVASLVHDDIIDADELRRGRLTIHKKFGMDKAILSGDALIFHLFLCLAECKMTNTATDLIVEAMRIVAQSGVDVCRGQMLETRLHGDLSCTDTAYINMIKLKTAAIFSGVTGCGAVLGGGSLEQIQALLTYGECLGIAFQIVDDLLEYTSTGKKIGKSTYSDLENKRLTLPIIYAYKRGTEADRQQIEQVFDDHYPLAEAHTVIKNIFQTTAAIEDSRMLAQQYANLARESLACFAPSTSLDRLHDYISLSIDRSS